MKQRKLAKFLAVTLSLELMVAPLIPHVRAAQESNNNNKSTNTAQAVNAGLQALGQIWQTVRNPNQMSGQMAADMHQLSQQQTAQPDKYFNPQKLSQIPGLGQYLALNNINPAMLDCKTLPTTLHDARPEVCRIGVTNDRNVHQSAQMTQMFTYHNQYFQVSKMYKNFSADSNSDGQAFGIGCMNNAMKILNGFFKYRMDELDKLTTNLEALNNQFREASLSDLNAIEETVAVLDGEPMASKVKGRKPDLFDFGKRFNNPACNSMFTGDTLDDMGRTNGLNAINKDMRAKLTDKSGGKYSGESYARSHAAVVEDINSVADKIAKQVELNFSSVGNDPRSYSEFLKSMPGLVSSPNRVQNSITPDLLSDVQTKYTENFAKFSENKATIQSELRGSERAMSMIGGLNSSNFEAEVNTLENNIKNSCLQSTLGSAGSRQELMNKIYDPSASKHANKNASNFLKDKLNQILDNPDTSIEKKLADLKTLESQQGSRYYMKMENSYEVQEVDANGNIKTRVVGASTNRTPSVYFSDIIKNCNAQFSANKLNNKLTGAAAIQKLRQLNQDFKSMAKTQAADIKSEIRKKLVECESPEIANNSVSGSCGPGLFNPSTPGFCANAARSCSINMQTCAAQADNFVKQTRQEKTARVNNYKALAKKNKMDIVKIFDTALARYMKDGEMMRGIFGAGFSSPAGIIREVPEGQRYLSEFARTKPGSPDGQLLLEDPDKYVEMFKNNIALLKESVKKQQDQILGGENVGSSKGLLADHIKQTQKNYQTVYKEAEATAKLCLDKHDGAILAAKEQQAQQQAEQMKRMSELGEKRSKFCNAYDFARTSPVPGCSSGIEEAVQAGLESAHMTSSPQERINARETATNLANHCRNFGSFNETKNGTGYTASRLCSHAKLPNSVVLKTVALRKKINDLCELKKAECTQPSETRVDVCTNRNNALDEDILSAFETDRDQNGGVGSIADVELEDAPAFCNGGDNSGTNVITKGLQDFTRTLGGQPPLYGAGNQ